jgi:Flp pilus assembly protein TadG
MSRLSELLKRFAADERGVFAVLFGVMAIVLIAMGGAVVDYVWMEQTRNRAQVALDAAALALQPRIFQDDYSDESVAEAALAILIERVGDARISDSIDIEAVRAVPEDGSLYLRARYTMPTTFVSLVGVRSLSARVESEATRKKLALEVVMVLDNSGSMQNEGRMANLVAAARCATNILMYSEVVDSGNTCIPAPGAELVEDVRVGLVPFTMYVNIGAQNANAGWIDRFGTSAIANDNFDNDDDEGTPFNTAFDRLALYDQISNDSWRGCVEARPHIKSGTLATEYLDTDDTTPVSGQPNTLFVPLFAPDTPDNLYSMGNYNNYTSDSPAVCDRPAQGNTTCRQVQLRTSCNSAMSNGSCTTHTAQTAAPVGPVNFSSSAKYPGAYYGQHAPGCSCRTWSSYSSWTHQSGSGNNQTFSRERTCVGGGYVPTGLSQREYQERVCKYYGNLSHSSGQTGPNADCPVQPLLPLTDDPDSVLAAINNMEALGGTNIHEGTAWGFRVLSPTAPFTEGAPYDEATSKVLIVMTDGENTAYRTGNLNGSYYYSAYGYPYNSRNTNANSSSGGNIERLGSISSAQGSVSSTNAQIVTEMNTRTSQTCANAKAQGITVYTIGLATGTVTQSTPATVQAMLTNCASTPDRARFPAAASELKETFAAIANDLSALRLAR